MMRQSTWIMSAVLMLGLVGVADAQFPKEPKRPAATQVAPTAEIAPAPPPVVNVAPPTVNVTPQVSLPAPSMMDEIKSWLTTIFGGLIALFLAKIGFKPAVATSTPALPGVPAGVSVVLSKLKDPDTLAGLEAIGLRVVQSGVPGTVIQGLAGAAGGGAIAAVIEPLVRQRVIEALGGTPTGPTAPDMSELTGIIASLKDIIEKRMPANA